ncbi:MAG: Hpt domain-containing protein, partial [Rhodocyclaceae bacterium]
MSDFAGMEDLLQDFLVEATDLLSGVDNKLVELEKNPRDIGLLNDIFRGFHTIKGGAGFLNATELVTLCHLTENLFDKLRNNELEVTKEIMDVILAATAAVREMFGHLESGMQPPPADAQLIAHLKAALAGQLTAPAAAAPAPAAPAAVAPTPAAPASGPDWDKFYGAVAVASAVPPAPTATEPVMHTAVAGQTPEAIIEHALGRRATDKPGAIAAPTGRRADEKARDTTIRVDTARLDQVLNLSGEIGLTKNRLNALRCDIINGRTDTDTLHALDQA